MSGYTNLERIRSFDRRLVEIIRSFLLLTPLSWPATVKREFLANVKAGKMQLPEVSYPSIDYSDPISRLEVLLEDIGRDEDPALSIIRDNAQSYLYAYQILQHVGTTSVNTFSRRLFGGPQDPVRGYRKRILDVANYILRVTLRYHTEIQKTESPYSSEVFQAMLQEKVAAYISPSEDPISITLTDSISAKAAAGPDYVHVRSDAWFSDWDLEQLLHHEVLTHTLTYINGRKQPILRCLGYAAPRTTATQEGLATFSEYITFSTDLVRLRRLALRIIAIHMAENGADLVDLFTFFKTFGQDDEESYLSAMRIFRGGFPKGGVVFYKDNVYLTGLIDVTGFLKEAMHKGSLAMMHLLFSGKITLGDMERLQHLSAQGVIAAPVYLPDWVKRATQLASHLALNDITERFKIV